ncbi:MAG TPA: nucleoside triphosphate pyrophosphohydrolase [Vicinamibacterales bacterium]|jgi:MazG family protein|nr:nucleoside triphosphate pyrophosphohydrolase [Vicinamibacterales bacterium]
MHAFSRLVEIMATLRGPGGCPWDREQTIDSLKPFVLEEAYEVLDAIDRHDHEALCEELGDFVFEAVFLAQLEHEAGHFTIDDSLRRIADKLVRRHPHVFARGEGEAPLDSAGQVRVRWEEIKAQERSASSRGGSLLAGIAPALPALLRAYHIGLRAASVHFDWPRTEDVVGKIEEEVAELREAVAAGEDHARAEEEMGDLLFSIAQLARRLGIEPETALRKANDKFTRRFTSMESGLGEAGRKMSDLSLDDLERAWQAAKAETDR